MSYEPDNLTLVYLRRLGPKVDRIIDNLYGLYASTQHRLDRMDGRLDRIERRLDFQEHAH